MDIKTLAKVFGVIFILIGIIGFIPAITSNGRIFGIFQVDLVHNIIHLLSGIIAFIAASSPKYAQLFFRIFGIIYGIVAIVGFVQGSTVLGLIGVNMADNILHLVIAIVSLAVGFGMKI